MSKQTQRLVWFIACLICFAGILLVVVGFFGNRQATQFSWLNYSQGDDERMLARLRSADRVAMLGLVTFGTGAIVMLSQLCFGWHGRRKSHT